MGSSRSNLTCKNKIAIFLAAMTYQSYVLVEANKLFLPKGFKLRYTIRALGGVEQPIKEIFGYIAESKHEIVIAFRGTGSFQDNESDQDIFQIPYPYVQNSGKTHRGFTCIYESTRNNIIRVLNKLSPTKRLYITGHSLGGALAVLAGLDIAVNTKFHKPIVYTYGSPRTGDPTFAAKYDNIVKNSVRVYNVHDIIPFIPDKVYPPPFTKEGLYYKHVNTKYPVSFQLNSVAGLNHSISCYFKNLSKKKPAFTKALCISNPGFCPDTRFCVPFLGGCGATTTKRKSSCCVGC
ncbi:lipase family protein [Paenibacillus sp. 481]|uniref:lipase family protein n=1 Tax=Paenibacillus sp. 481 TaxID=2835869 RepID=UPI001E5C6EBB|nr:lipase family protein [Paenibacillus sp. 481]UHA72477.1 lipase family protein [Paenibacillus sp. 481]